ncbi:MAG: methyl-accepting chemotaxis protein [Halioglobus sp.]|jgi:methyl-accepting chemotaxis protein
MDNRRTTIVINKKFQYQYSLLIAAAAVLLVNGFIILRMLFPGEQPLELSVGMALGLAAIEFVLILSIWYACLKASHKIAGPVYVFTREICKLAGGDLTAHIALRQKDMFQPEGIAINRSITALRDRVGSAKRLTEKLTQAQDQGADVGPIVAELAKEMAAFNTEFDN